MEKIATVGKLAVLCRVLTVHSCRQFALRRCYRKAVRTAGLQICRPYHASTHAAHSQCRTAHYRPWLDQPHKHLHASDSLCSSKLKNMKIKILKPVVFKETGTKKIVTISHDMTVQELADAMNKHVDHVFEVMEFVPGSHFYDKPNIPITNMHVIRNIIKKSGMTYQYREKQKKEKENKDEVKRPPAPPEMLVPRPPVVTIMGHVDHGKTTLLDAIRQSNVVETEFGGITQHIGAFSVRMSGGERITFLDTPGHAAFHAMRARGAHVTDLVVLVVAADDGVMLQTQESIKHAQDAQVPIIVAINKIDKYESDIDHVKAGLLQYGITLEDMGGDIQAVPISALKGTNLDMLQEAILAQAEMMELRADHAGLVEGAVIESATDVGRGKLATVLVQRGTLRKGSVIVAGTAWAKVRGMFNDQGMPVVAASPGDPVEVIGWRELPHAGQEVLEVETERRAHEVLTWRKAVAKQEQSSESAVVARAKLEEHQRLYRAARQEQLARGIRRSAIARRDRIKEVIASPEGPQLAIILKGDVDGSVEAILEVLDSYDSDQCRLDLMSYGVGSVNDSDIEMASNFSGIIYAFNVVPTKSAKELARTKGVSIREHNIIYKMIDDIRVELKERLRTEEVPMEIGTANVLQVFMVTDKNKKFPVAGCRCNKGQLNRKKQFKVIRDDEVIADGELASLKHFKNEVETVKTDVECGMMFKDTSFKPERGDTIICYEMKEVKPELDWDLEF